MSHAAYQWTWMVLWILGTGRLIRLVVADAWPPMEKLRARFYKAVDYGPWTKLMDCLWCASPWLAVPGLVLGALFHWIVMPDGLPWYQAAVWLFFVWLAVAYLASWFVRHDEPDEPHHHEDEG